jgi:arabinofuranosyltransferase
MAQVPPPDPGSSGSRHPAANVLPTAPGHGSDRTFKICVVLVLTILYSLFIDRFSFTLNGERYFALSDDQMISMRYASNLAEGLGLVWNPGEHVEGFTNPLWTVYMAVWHLAGVPSSKTSLAILATSALILILNALTVYSIASILSPRSKAVPRAAMVLAGTYWSLVHWSLTGFEVGLTALLTSLVVLHTFTYQESGRTRQLVIIAGCLIALGWTRLEMLAVAGVPVAYLLATSPERARIVAVVGLPVVASVVILFGARFWYYGEWLPNTYYLKLTGVALEDRVRLGISRAVNTLLTHFSIVLVPIALSARALKIDRRVWIPMAMGAVGLAYTIYIGGDTWERPYHANRFLSAITPLLLVVAVGGTWELLGQNRRPAFASPVIMTLLVLLMTIGLGGRTFRQWMLADLERTKLFAQVALGELLREHAPPDARIAVVWAGAAPYFSRLYSIDLLGKSDKVIARSAPHNMNPGHNKWDYSYSIGVLKPDYIVELFRPTPEDMAYIANLGYSPTGEGIFVRQGP